MLNYDDIEKEELIFKDGTIYKLASIGLIPYDEQYIHGQRAFYGSPAGFARIKRDSSVVFFDTTPLLGLKGVDFQIKEKDLFDVYMAEYRKRSESKKVEDVQQKTQTVEKEEKRVSNKVKANLTTKKGKLKHGHDSMNIITKMANKDDPDFLHMMLADAQTPEDVLPQVRVREIVQTMIPDNMLRLASTYPILAIAKSLMVHETVQVGTSTVGKLYLAYVTLLYDIYKAMKGEITVFTVMDRGYRRLRHAITPKKIGRYSMNFDTSAYPTFQDWLTTGIPFNVPGTNSVISWKTGAVDVQGQFVLANVQPAFVEEDLIDYGVEAVQEMWQRMYKGRERLVGEKDWLPTDDTAAAYVSFDSTTPPSADYLPLRYYSSEIEIPLEFDDIAALNLGKNQDSRRGTHTRATIYGTAAHALKVDDPTLERHYVHVKPKEISGEQYFFTLCTALAVADLRYNDVKGYESIIQPQDSVLKLIDPGSFITAGLAALSRRYAWSAAILNTTGPLFANSELLFAGTAQASNSSTLQSVQASFINELMADLSPFIMKKRGRIEGHLCYEARVPYVAFNGQLCFANPLENGGQNLSGVESVLRWVYPDANIQSYDFKSPQAGDLLPVLDVVNNASMWFQGQGPDKAIRKWNSIFNLIQGNVMISNAAGNAHGKSTRMHYTAIHKASPPVGGYSTAIKAVRIEVSNTHAFDANQVPATLQSMLPVAYTFENGDVYISVTGETTSLQTEDMPPATLTQSSEQYIHFLFGQDAEAEEILSMEVMQSHGGGFFDFVKSGWKVLGPIIGNQGADFADKYLPGIGGVIKGLSKAITTSLGSGKVELSRKDKGKLLNHLWKNSDLHPWASILRPYSSGLVTGGTTFKPLRLN